MKKSFLTLCFLLCLLGKAIAFQTNDSLQISLLTCSPGEFAYEKFGHTAIRVIDKSKNLDIVFNYGIFSFDTENFYYKFIKGETDYMLGVTNTVDFLPEYAARNSSVTEQILNLTTEEKERLLQALLVNYEPQNRKYRYNFVYDNCSTRPRDMIMASVDGIVSFPKETFELKTFRAHIEDYAGWNTWLMFGIDIVFGTPADSYTGKMTSMFLPEILMAEFKNAKIIQPKEKNERNLIQNEVVLVPRTHKEASSVAIFSPIAVCILLLIAGIGITLWDLKRRRRNKLFNSLLFIITGLAGVIVFYLSFISIHPLVQGNYNLLWLCPLNLIAGIIIWFRPLRKLLFYYLIVYSLMLLIALFVFMFNIQSSEISFITLIILLLTRSLHWITYRRKRKFSMRLNKSKNSRRQTSNYHHKYRAK